MQYKLKTGDLIFIDSGTKIGKLVKIASMFRMSHVAIYVGNGLIFDIDFNQRSRFRKIEELKVREYEIKRHRDIDNFMFPPLKDFQRMTKRKYDYTGAIKSALKKYGITFKCKDNPHRYWCSELARDYYELVGKPLINSTNYPSIEDLYNSKKLETIIATHESKVTLRSVV